jgi:glycogen debranching enzyme
MIKITFPGILQDEFEEAFRVFEECKVTKLPSYGFIYPYMGPGGQYGACWWERDSSLTLSGYMWEDQLFAENVMRNFIAVQKENGRIPLYGADRVGDFDEQLSAIPVLFEVAYKILRRSTDKALTEDVYKMLCRYLEWWLSPIKRDSESGLVCAIFEETDPSDTHDQLTIAPLDLNMQIIVGCDVLSKLALHLGKNYDYEKYTMLFNEMKDRINRYNYCEADGAYYAYLTKEKKLQTSRLYNSMFDLFKRSVIPANRAGRIKEYLTDNKYFNWDGLALTTMSKTSPEYTETVGVYQGAPSWSGNIWTLRNEIIITGLREYGEYELSAALAIKTVREFNNKYTEFMSPSTGIGHGVQRYGWTASQYIQLIIEEIFGIDYCSWNDTLRINPNLDKSLRGEQLSLENIKIPGHDTLNVYINYDNEKPTVKYNIEGSAPVNIAVGNDK